jgi:uncharacterized protein (TIGR02679 family)
VGHVDHERLNRLLGSPELEWVVDRARRRMEHGLALDGVVSLSTASPAQRDALARLLGRRLSAARGVSVSLGDVDAVLRRSGAHPGGLAGAVETLTGAVVVRAEAIGAAELAWAGAFAPLELAAEDRPAVASWVARLRSTGIVKRLANGSPAEGAELVGALCQVLVALPCEPAESLAAFGARVLGRAHALDDGTPLGTLALGAARAVSGLAPPETGESLSEARREAWAAVGVLCDELSSVVLTLGLPGDTSATGAVLSAARAAGEPVWLTLRQLVRTPPAWAGFRSVLVVENPSVIALAADRIGSRSPPLVCTHGQPRAAAIVLLRSLTAGGVRLRHHGDFDWPGVTIGNLLHRRLDVEAWRFDASAYRAAAAAQPHTATLSGAPVAASWDPQLMEAMRETGRQIEEELVAPGLLDALDAGR